MLNPVSGIKTVTATPAEAFAGASRLTGRSMLIIRNLSTSTVVRWGGSGVTQANGMPIEPGETAEIPAPDTVPIYLVSDGQNVQVAIAEW